MAYIVQADITPQRLSLQDLTELTDDAKTGEVDTTVLNAVLEEASSEIDGYVSGRYTLPLQATPQVKQLARDIAVFRLFLRKRKTKVPISVVDADPMGASYLAATRYLEKVRDGEAALDSAALKQITQMDVVTKDHTTDPDVFDATKLEGF
jgi:phage gp36-like protein